MSTIKQNFLMELLLNRTFMISNFDLVGKH